MSLGSIFGVQSQNFLWHICLYHSNCVGDLCERQRTGQRSITGKQTNKQGLWRGSIMDRKTKVIRLVVAVSLFIEIHKKKKLSIEHCLLCNHIAIDRKKPTNTNRKLFVFQLQRGKETNVSALHLFCIDHQAGQQQGKEDGALLFRISLAVFFLENATTV